MMELTITEIARAVGGTLVAKGDITQKISGVVLDSRQVEEGSVFLATLGERVDGHRFIGDVFQKGAALVIAQETPQEVETLHGIPAGSWGSYVKVDSTLNALKALGEYYRRKLSIPVIGITGSVGKTSTKEFVAGVLGQKYHVLKTEGNYNNEIGVPLTLLKIRPEHTAAVIEMGISEFGEMQRLSKMARPDICVITNIGQCHLENLKTRDGILQAKTEILDYMPKTGRVCFWGEDDKLSTQEQIILGKCLEEGGAVVRPYFFGLGEKPGETVRAENITGHGLLGSDCDLVIDYGDEGVRQFPVRVPLPGSHMVVNACAAACVARLLGLTPEEIREGLAGLQATKGRGQILSLCGRTVIDDCYNANPVSMCAGIDLLAAAEGEKAAILGDMFELGEECVALHEKVGRYGVRSGLETILCVGENARHMYLAAVEEAQSCMLEKENWPAQKIFWVESTEKLLEILEKEEEEYLPRETTVLLKASHGMHFERVLEYWKSQGKEGREQGW